MIGLTNVTMDIGKGDMKRRVLHEVSWTILPRSHFVILGQAGVGKSLLLQIIAGLIRPTSGRVERRGAICPPGGFASLTGPGSSARQLASRVARIYRCDERQVIEFTRRFTALDDLFDVPLKWLPAPYRSRLYFALRYAIPFDYYLFDGTIGGRDPDLHALCMQAFEQRSDKAGTIVTTRSVKVASRFHGTGGVLFRGKLFLYSTIAEAIEVYGMLPDEKFEPGRRAASDSDSFEEEEILDF